MSALTEEELAYLYGERRLARIATVGADGTPHEVPVGWSFEADQGTIEVGGRDLMQTKKFRDVQYRGRASMSSTISPAPLPGAPRNRDPRPGRGDRSTAPPDPHPSRARLLLGDRPNYLVSRWDLGHRPGPANYRDQGHDEDDVPFIWCSSRRPPFGPLPLGRRFELGTE